MAEEASQIQAKPLRGYDARNPDGLWVEWSNSDGAWYVRITLYDGSVGEGNVAARQTFPLTNEVEQFENNDHTFTEAVAGHTYYVGVKYYPEADSEAWLESDESYTEVTYTPTVVDPPLDATVFKLRDKDDAGNELLYLGATTASFVADLVSRHYTKVVFSLKKSTAPGWEYDSIELDPTVVPDSGTGYEWNILESGYYKDWFQLDLAGLEPNTTYLWSAIGYHDESATTAFEDEFTTLAAPATQLATPSIDDYPRASDNYKYSTLQIRLAAPIPNATSYEYQIATNSTFTTGLLTRTSATVTSGYPLSGYFTGLTEGRRYYCRARALSSNSTYSTSEWSNVGNTTVTAHLPEPVVTVSNRTTTSATLSWGAVVNSSSYTAGYRLSGTTNWTNSTELANTSATFQGLNAGATYEYQVIAVGNDSTFTTSTAATGTFTTLIPLDAPTGLAASSITIDSARVSWNTVAHASGYKVEYREEGAPSWTSIDVE